MASLALVVGACSSSETADDSPAADTGSSDTPTQSAESDTESPSEAPSDDAEEPAEEAPAEEEPEAGVEGCGEGSWVDPNDLSETRALARCDRGFPLAQPLEQARDLTISITSSATHTAPIFLADAMGEFAAENLNVTIEQIPPADALSMVAQGTLDAAWTGPQAPTLNAVNKGFDLVWVMGNYAPAADSQTGLWIAAQTFDDPADATAASMSGRTLASGLGPESVISYPIYQTLKNAGVDISEVEFVQIPYPDMPIALSEGAVNAAWVLDPYWRELVDIDDAVFAAGQPPLEPLGGLMFGKNLLEDTEAGDAVMRALVRTVNTYLYEGWTEDADVLEVLAGEMGSTPEAIVGGGELQFDWEVRAGTIIRMQEAYLAIGNILEYNEPISEDRLVDRSYYERVVGHR